MATEITVLQLPTTEAMDAATTTALAARDESIEARNQTRDIAAAIPSTAQSAVAAEVTVQIIPQLEAAEGAAAKAVQGATAAGDARDAAVDAKEAAETAAAAAVAVGNTNDTIMAAVGGNPQTAFAIQQRAAFVRRRYVPLIVIAGESNAGGQAPNTALTDAEKAVRPAVQILNNTTLTFEALHIGVNSSLGHYGIDPTVSHGWEAGLADSAEAGEWADQVYLVKAGQGGSRLAQWAAGGDYITRFKTRVDAAVAAIRAAGYEPQIYLWLTIGINDNASGLSVSDFGVALAAWISQLRAITGPAPIMLTRLPVPYHSYNPMLEHFDDSDYLIWGISTQNLPMDDIAHWSSQGMKRLARSMIDRSLQTMGQGQEYQSGLARAHNNTLVSGVPVQVWQPVTWTNPTKNVSGDSAGLVSLATASIGGAIGDAIDATKNFEIEAVIDSNSLGAVVALTDSPTPVFTYDDAGGPMTWFADVFRFGTTLSTSSHGVAAPVTLKKDLSRPVHVRLRKSGMGIAFAVSDDGGLTFTDVYYLGGALVGKKTIYIKAMFAANLVSSVRVATRTLVD